MQNIKIAVLGLGGVGGYFGGKLAKRYAGSGNVGIYFFARGEHLKAINEYGIHIVNENEDFFARPDMATNDARETGIVDYIIVTTKSYDLKASIDQIRPCIGKKTVILPLLNGGDITERIREILPENTVWSGCSYIVARKTEPGVIHTSGQFLRFIFGYDGGTNEEVLRFDKLLRDAEIDVYLPKNIRESIWRKFYFISVSASLTSYFDTTFNELVDTEQHRNTTIKMAKEFLEVAQAEGIPLVESDTEHVLNRLELLPAGSTSSMNSDFEAGNKTEVETLTGVVVRLAQKHNISVPLYVKVYNELSKR